MKSSKAKQIAKIESSKESTHRARETKIAYITQKKNEHVVGMNTDIHKTSSFDSSILKVVKKGSIVHTIKTLDDWALIRTDNEEGWIPTRLLHKKS
jgi:SH3-like domain-containing protein